MNLQDWIGQGQHPTIGSCECSDNPSGSIYDDRQGE
jgi:hypothetical protein